MGDRPLCHPFGVIMMMVYCRIRGAASLYPCLWSSQPFGLHGYDIVIA